MFHFKEREPKETIKIISDFFQKNNIILKEHGRFVTECGSWYCGISLEYDGQEILWSNGKGYTEELAVASGYAEAYERFCNGLAFKGIDPLLIKSKEKTINFNDIQTIFPGISKKYFELYNNSYFNRKYININDINDVQIFNNFFLISYNGSSGMCAGNSLEEALNQGISELYEHYVLDQYSFIDKKSKKYCLDLQYLIESTPKYLSNMLKKIISYSNYNFYIFDFSYNFHVPVLMSCLINKDTHCIQICFGSFPIFEIALERVITELYQGIQTFQTKKKYTEPFLDIDSYHYSEFFTDPANVTYVNESIFFNLEKKCKPNNKVFLFNKNKNYNIQEIFSYYQQLSKSNGINFYYTNNSLKENIYALHIYAPKLSLHTVEKQTINNHFKKNDYYKLLFLKEEIKEQVIFYQCLDEKLIINMKQLIDSFETEDLNFLINNFFFDNDFFTYGKRIDFFTNSFIDILYNPFFTKFLWNRFQVPFAEKIKEKCIVYDYAVSQKYNIFEKIDILNKLLNYNIKVEDLINILNKKYFIENSLLNPIKELYQSEKMKNFINIFINNRRD